MTKEWTLIIELSGYYKLDNDRVFFSPLLYPGTDNNERDTSQEVDVTDRLNAERLSYIRERLDGKYATGVIE